MRSERFMDEHEIRAMLDGSNEAGGPVMAVYDGVAYKQTGEGHTIELGETGTGKTRRGIIMLILSFIFSILHESFVCIDPKGELYKRTACFAKDQGYDVRLVNYRNVLRSFAFNPLLMAYTLFKTGDIEDRQRCDDLLCDIAYALYPDVSGVDPFWNQAARELFLAVCYTLFYEGTEAQVHIPSLYNIIAKGSEKVGGTTKLKQYADQLPDTRPDKLLYQTYISAPNDTALSIRSVFLNGLAPYIVNLGLKNMMCLDTMDILNMDDSKPLAIYIVLADESSAYETQAAMLCNQLIRHFITVAQSRPNDALARRMNIVLEELASIGRALPNLDHLMAAARSRNIRIHCVLQDIEQLTTLYGEAKASAIRGNADIILYRVRNPKTLREYSFLCGEKVIQLPNGMERTEPLVSSAQLMQMDVGQVLVMVRNQKFISKLPDYTQIFDVSGWRELEELPYLPRKAPKMFDLTKHIKVPSSPIPKYPFGI